MNQPSDLLGKLHKRACHPVQLSNRETVHCRSMTIAELRELDSLPKVDQPTADKPDLSEFRTPFVMGCVIVNADGSQGFPRLPDEDARAFATRMLDVLKDVATENIAAISEVVGKIGKVPGADTLKNSSGTTRTAS